MGIIWRLFFGGVLKLPYNFRVNGNQTQTLGQKTGPLLVTK